MKKSKKKNKSKKYTNQRGRNILRENEAEIQIGTEAGRQTDRPTAKQTDRKTYLNFKNLLKRYLPSKPLDCFLYKNCS